MNTTDKIRHDNAAIRTARLVLDTMDGRLMSQEEAEALVASKAGISHRAVHAFTERGLVLIRSGWA